MQELIQHINTYHRLSESAVAALQQHFQRHIFPKNEHLLREGQVCRHLYFMVKGALRGYYTVDGKEITHWFAFENNFVTSFHSYITYQPAVENIQLLEGCVLLSISKEKLEQLYNEFPEIERAVRLTYEKYYIRLEERFVNAQFTSAAERYSSLLEQYPEIISRIPLGHIASYLGISQETLSRIRSRL